MEMEHKVDKGREYLDSSLMSYSCEWVKECQIAKEIYILSGIVEKINKLVIMDSKLKLKRELKMIKLDKIKLLKIYSLHEANWGNLKLY